MPDKAIRNLYEKKLRVRACGLCYSNDSLLLVKHRALSAKGYFFAPPGGGMEYRENAEDCLRREFAEETGLLVRVREFLFVHEFLAPPLHAVELFFSVEAENEQLVTGYDPELSFSEQIIESVGFYEAEEINAEKGEQMHHMINLAEHPRDLLEMRGYFNFRGGSLK